MDQITKLAENGLLGLLLALSFGVIAFLYKEVRNLQDKRVQDLKEYKDALAVPMQGLTETAKRTLALVEKLTDAR